MDGPQHAETNQPAEDTRFAILLFSDICNSTGLKEEHGAPAYATAARLHNELFERLAAEEKLTIVKNTGDGYLAHASSVAAVVRFALRFQDGMRSMPWPSFLLTSRVGIHAGEVADITTLGRPDVIAPAVDLTARIMSLAIGGQILLSYSPYSEGRRHVLTHPSQDDVKGRKLEWVSHGAYRFAGADEPLEVFEVGIEGLAPLVIPPETEKAKRSSSRHRANKKTKQPHSWRLTSSRESIDRGDITVLAIFETLLALGALIMLSSCFNTMAWLAGAASFAPLLLLRTPYSVETGLRWRNWVKSKRADWIGFAMAVSSIVHTALLVWLFGKWTFLIWMAFGAAILFAYRVEITFLIRATALAFTIPRHFRASVISIPENWKRVVLSTDICTPPEWYPGDSESPNEYIRDWKHRSLVSKWVGLTAYPVFFVTTTAYRWSVKATCLVYLPLIWLVRTARFPSVPLYDALHDYQASDLRRCRVAIAGCAILLFIVKCANILWFSGIADWLETYAPLRFLKHYFLPGELPWWQILTAVNGLITIWFWGYTRYVLRKATINRAPSEESVCFAWGAFRWVSGLISMYTITCALIITWHAGDILGTLHRLWLSVGHHALPPIQ